MNIDTCFYLGFVQKLIGVKGELAFKLDADSPSLYTSLDSILLQVHPNDKSLIPYFVDHSQVQNTGTLRCKLEGIDSQDQAKRLIGQSIFLPLSLLPELKGNQFYFHEVIGYTIVDEEFGEIGELDKVIEYPKSNLFSILRNDKEVLIPINDETILNVNREEKTILVKSPEGLIDLYLE